MKVIWSPRAKMARVATVRYLFEEFGYKTASKFDAEVKEVVAQIKQFPGSGQEEKFLANEEMKFHSVPVGAYSKIVYRALENEIHIDDIWDTRREPIAQANNTVNQQNHK